jgi:hypothetical protein
MTDSGNENPDLAEISEEIPADEGVELGPFAPPRDFEAGDEFLPIVPRPIPGWVRQGAHARHQRGAIYSLAALGVMCLVLWPVPFVQGLSHYILPLKWLHWIGLGLFALAGIQSVQTLFSSGRRAYLRQGIPFPGRVISIQHAFSGTAEAPLFHFAVTVEFDDPQTGEHRQSTVISPDGWRAAKMPRYECSLHPGDYVVLVALPDKFDSSLTVYGLLGLNPECEFITKDGRPLQGLSPYTAVMTAFLIGFIIVLCMAAFDVMMFSIPISGDWKIPLGLAVGGLFLFGSAAAIWRHWAQVTGEPPKKLAPVFLVYGFLGAVAAPLAFAILNARLDRAPGELVPIEIVQFWETTHDLIIRDYEIEYRMLDSQDTEKHHVRYSQITGLGGAHHGVLNVGPGRFGYPWIRNVHPLTWIPTDEFPDVDGPAYRVVVSQEQSGDGPPSENVYELKPAIEIGLGQFVPVPKELIDPATADLRSQVVDLRPIGPADGDAAN